jgi:hypothetical protein
MTTEETQQLTETLLEALKGIDPETAADGGYGYIYIIISAIPTFILIGRQIRRAFVKAIEKVMKTHVDQMEHMMGIMEMHIDELKHVKSEQASIKQAHEKIEEQVKEHGSIIQRIKDNC